MRKRDPEIKQEIIDFVNQYYMENHVTPSVREIARNTSVQKSAVHNYLKEMSDNGELAYNRNLIVTDLIDEKINGFIHAPVYGAVACGSLTMEDGDVEDYVDLPVNIFGDKPLFVLRANGNSMTGAGIDDGDYVVIRKQESAWDGDLVVAYVDGEGNTLKRYLRDDKKRRIILHPENDEYPDIVVKECRIQGVVQQIIKNVS